MRFPESRIAGRVSPGKKAALIALLIAAVLLGLFLGAFLNYRLHNKTYSATFVVNESIGIQTAA